MYGGAAADSGWGRWVRVELRGPAAGARLSVVTDPPGAALIDCPTRDGEPDECAFGAIPESRHADVWVRSAEPGEIRLTARADTLLRDGRWTARSATLVLSEAGADLVPGSSGRGDPDGLIERVWTPSVTPAGSSEKTRNEEVSDEPNSMQSGEPDDKSHDKPGGKAAEKQSDAARPAAPPVQAPPPVDPVPVQEPPQMPVVADAPGPAPVPAPLPMRLTTVASTAESDEATRPELRGLPAVLVAVGALLGLLWALAAVRDRGKGRGEPD
ncbi:hypothetical protein DP939_18965 [Spongiactinospora rosea]|uniref:Uncharacterized protein n=2 Tax=Spongiactinospora rosea TaxID=2248750 RepID=A0A366LX96_9ACTN|nr:hypothetical protein DP939_18965 [Spongiactinospora rosea]